MATGRIEREEARSAIIFVMPFMIVLLVFQLFPIIYTFVLSFADFNRLRAADSLTFAGLENYRRVLTTPETANAFLRTLVFAIIYVPVVIGVSLLLALLLNESIVMQGTVRTLILVPYVSNIVAVAIIWNAVLSPFGGPLNKILAALGVQDPPLWLAGIDSALPTVALINVWKTMAFHTVVYLAALQSVPSQLL